MPCIATPSLPMTIKHAKETKHARPNHGDVGERESDCESWSCENYNQNRNILPSFIANFILGPFRTRWLARKNTNHGEAEHARVLLEGRSPREAPTCLPNSPVLKPLGSQTCSRIPHVASQSHRMELLLLDEHPRIDLLQKAAWNGCSSKNRAQVWRLLARYEPLGYSHRSVVLDAKRARYQEYVKFYCESDACPDFHKFGRFDSSEVQCLQDCPPDLCELRRSGASSSDEQTSCELSEASISNHFGCRILRQINLDLPRTHPDTRIFHVTQIRDIMRRVLFIYSMVNPRKSYVQGMNEILTPLVVVYISNLMKSPSGKGVEDFLKRKSLPSYVKEKKLDAAEADIFWVFSHFMSSLEDNFISEQPGILKRISRLQQIVSDVDPALASHLAVIEVQFLQFAYRWMNCLLMRELPLPLVVRVWDVLLAEDDGISDLHVYLCAALITHFSDTLMSMDFEEAILFLQRLPTKEWTTTNIDKMLDKAYHWKATLGFESLAGHSPSDPSVIDVKRLVRAS